LGRIVERGPADAVLRSPKHPYTEALLSAVPSPRREENRALIRLAGETPSPVSPPPGCHFHPRCPRAMARCRVEYPQAFDDGAARLVRCHLYAIPHAPTHALPAGGRDQEFLAS
ncbi:MAG: hypothetical protein LBS49_08875, partial [Candidatus Accumulibacter sp.]|nr:hypothetical protein [Accumulibacter sp.]